METGWSNNDGLNFMNTCTEVLARVGTPLGRVHRSHEGGGE
jgi:hypothetical protein